MIYYTADTHFGDGRILKLCRRPFRTVEEMNEELIRRWNAKVLKSDTVWLLGDVAVDEETAARILPKLNGKVHLLLGNHDVVLTDSLRYFESVSQIKTIEDQGWSVCLCHYPLLSFENSVYGGYHVFGHIHNNPQDIATQITKTIPRIYNAGVDECDFIPRSLSELEGEML